MKRARRIEEVAPWRLVEKFSTTRSTVDSADSSDDSTETTVSATSTGGGVSVTVSGETRELTRREADRLREALGRALTERREFLHTAGERRDDGSYVVSRRGADSAGHRKVFSGFDALTSLYDRLPETFTAEEVGERGLTGGRRHILVHHFAEHPTFDCELVSRQPLTARKSGTSEGTNDSTRGNENAVRGNVAGD